MAAVNHLESNLPWDVNVEQVYLAVHRDKLA